MLKHFYLILVFFFCTNVFGQNDLLGEWFLHYIEINGVQQYSTIPNSFNNIIFDEVNFNGTICDNGYGGNYILNSDTVLTISGVSALAGYCNYPIESQSFLNPYLWTVLSDSNASNTFGYSISGSGNDESLILTNSDNSSAYYGRSPLPENHLPGMWFLHSITKNSVEEINTYQPTFSMNFTMIAGSFSSLDYDGTAVCNDYFGEYHLEGLNNIRVLSISYTLAICQQSGGSFEESYLSFFADSNSGDMLLNYSITGSGDDETLILTDEDGDYLVYGRQTLSVNENTFNNFSIRLKENPVSTELKLNVRQALGNRFNYTINSIEGKQILKEELLGNHVINVDGLKSGMYFLTIQSNNNHRQTLKFIKD